MNRLNNRALDSPRMQSVPEERTTTKVDSPPKQISIGEVLAASGNNNNNSNNNNVVTGKEGKSDGDKKLPSGKSDKGLSISVDQRTRDNAARYAALRNHRIRFEDAIDPNAERVKTLNKHDVIFGRGRGYQNHPGNLRMRTIIDKYKHHYHDLKRQGKRDMVEQVYKEIVEGGARFLKKLDDEDEWVKVDVPIALQKVSHTLRCRKKSAEELAEAAEASTTAPSPKLSALEQLQLDTTAALQADQMSSLSMLQDRSALSSLGGSLASANPYLELEAQRLAVLQNHVALSGLPSMSSLMQPMHTSVEYYNMLRRDQLVRETIALQQMREAVGNHGSMMQHINAASFPSLSQQSNMYYDRLQLMQRGGGVPNEPSTMGQNSNAPSDQI